MKEHNKLNFIQYITLKAIKWWAKRIGPFIVGTHTQWEGLSIDGLLTEWLHCVCMLWMDYCRKSNKTAQFDRANKCGKWMLYNVTTMTERMERGERDWRALTGCCQLTTMVSTMLMTIIYIYLWPAIHVRACGSLVIARSVVDFIVGPAPYQQHIFAPAVLLLLSAVLCASPSIFNCVYKICKWSLKWRCLTLNYAHPPRIQCTTRINNNHRNKS